MPTTRRTPRDKTPDSRMPGPRALRYIKMAVVSVLMGVLLGSASLAWRAVVAINEVFDENRAMTHLIRQVSFGPRVPGSRAHQECLAYITSELEKHLCRVEHHKFSYDSLALGMRVEGTNIMARAKGRGSTARKDFVFLCAHWDSRPIADRSPDSQDKGAGVPGANDGASGVAVILEVARILGLNPPPVDVQIVLFDMEDMGGLPTSGLFSDPYCIGSIRFLEDHPHFRPRWGILLDMVGKKDLRIPKERFSLAMAPEVVELIWSVARRLNKKAFVEELGPAVLDDHVPFLERNIKVINLIDMDYPQWHTLYDLPEHCSSQSLKDVGEVVLEAIYKAK